MREAMQKALNGKACRIFAGRAAKDNGQKWPRRFRRWRAMPAPADGRGPAAMPAAGMPGLLRTRISRMRSFRRQPNGSQLEVLLRPGLLADVEIILEKIPDAINIPNQAVFEKDGKQIVYVRNGKGWEERVIKPLKRSESVMVIASGVKPGEIIALADPTAKPGDKKKRRSGSAQARGRHAGGGRS